MKEPSEDKKNSTEPNTENRTKKPVKKSVLWGCIAVACLITVFVCGSNIARAEQEKQRQAQIQELAQQAEEAESAKASVSVKKKEGNVKPSQSSKPTATPKPRKENERDIDFASLQEQNPDVIAWIEVPGTEIDYPVLTVHNIKDNEYYLHHDMLYEESEYGAIYTDILIDPSLEEPFLLVYGHNMKDGSMFAGLHLFEEEEFFKENRIIKLYTPEGQMDFKVFAAYQRDDAHVIGLNDFSDKEVMSEYLDGIRNMEDEEAIIDMDGVTEEDTVLTLSTCVTGEDENRYIVQAVFVEP